MRAIEQEIERLPVVLKPVLICQRNHKAAGNEEHADCKKAARKNKSRDEEILSVE